MIQRISVLAAVLIAGCTTAHPPHRAARAQTIDSLKGPGPYAFDCDAPAGKADSRNIRLPSGALRVTGLLQILTARKDVAYNASAGIELVAPALGAAAALQLLVRNDDPSKVVIAFGTASAQPEDNAFASIPFASEPTPFALTVDRSGAISASFGGVASPQPLRFSGATYLAIGCSTARVRFSNVTVASATGSRR
jgi:hypothetical protein